MLNRRREPAQSSPEEEYAKEYERWRASVEKKRRHQSAPEDDYFAKTYAKWKESQHGSHHRSVDDDDALYWRLPLRQKLVHRYRQRRWLLLADLAAAFAITAFLVTLGVRNRVFTLRQTPRSMDEATDSPYMRKLREQVEKENRALEKARPLR